MHQARVNGLLSPGKVLVFDLHGSHTSQECRAEMDKAGVIYILLPLLSSPFNPIERLWSWVKRKWRDRLAETVGRTENVQWITAELDQICRSVPRQVWLKLGNGCLPESLAYVRDHVAEEKKRVRRQALGPLNQQQ